MAIDEVQLEHRLTALEGKIEGGFMQVTTAINDLSAHVGKQNGRIGKLEQMRAQLLAIVATVMALAPFSLFALNRIVK
jgi:uncharacterized coiled-coil protein SlyX